jgi:hypothetical protein
MAQYGSFQNFTWESIEQAKNARQNLIKKIGDDTTTAQTFTKELSYTDIEKKLTTDE